jgi:hypothetical protein
MTDRYPAEVQRARGLLLAEIQAERGSGDRSHRAFPFRGASRLRPAMLGGVAAATAVVTTAMVATAVAIALVFLPPPTVPQPTPSRPPGGSPGPWIPQTSGSVVLTAAYVLNHAASAAAAPLPVPRPGQFIYISSVTTDLSEGGESTSDSWLYKTSRQIWQSADGQQAGLLQIVDGGNVKLPAGTVPPADNSHTVRWMSVPASSCPGAAPAPGTYEFLTSLPTDPGRLRTWLYQHPNGENPPNVQAWTDIGDMLREMLVPPKLAAALYQVAATIPGVTAVPHVVNAVGRAGVGVSRSGAELIFDPRTFQLIGEGTVLTKAVRGQGPAGTVISADAEVRVAVVDHLPKVLPSSVDKSGGGATC